MNKFTIYKSGKLYSFFESLSNWFPFAVVLTKDYDDNLKMFNDICTFVRTILMLVLLVIPMTVMFFGTVIFVTFGLTTLNVMNGGWGYSPLFVLFLIPITYLVLVYFEYKATLERNFNDSLTYEELMEYKASRKKNIVHKEPGPFKLFWRLLCSKHKQFCERLEIKD